MYQLIPTTRFEKDLKKVKKNEKDFRLTAAILKILQSKGVNGIPSKMKPHRLTGRYSDNWEYHIKPDLLIIWIQIESPNVIKLVCIGSHSDLFK
nr:type II toxin-antitoxin system YafQ family toxin [Allomuricauda sp.]